jgi:hypothetical protein
LDDDGLVLVNVCSAYRRVNAEEVCTMKLIAVAAFAAAFAATGTLAVYDNDGNSISDLTMRIASEPEYLVIHYTAGRNYSAREIVADLSAATRRHGVVMTQSDLEFLARRAAAALTKRRAGEVRVCTRSESVCIEFTQR